ncbi:MAG: glutathione S-transferase family protein [Pseudorhodoplanes sp.]|uniref:glutathione S-transferase family protein n=1 Tax=Pseudorhodoplanes sp. TaxID=1934341 RepID=UPI003D14748E
MKLFWTPASPFVRKVMVAAIECDLDHRLEVHPTYWPHEWATQTVDFDPQFIAANPVGRIPTLVTEDGIALPEANWICSYLDSLLETPRLFPLSGKPHWEMLRVLAIADGAIEAMILRRAETLRHPPERSEDFIGKQRARIARCLDEVEKSLPAFRESAVDMRHISIAIACSYMDFRYEADHWRNGRPVLAAWHERFSQRPSMTRTQPGETPQSPGRLHR